MLKILIADDHAIVRRGLKDILLEEFPSALIDEAIDADELIKRVLKEDYNIVITDLSMPGRSGLEALQQIKLHKPKTPVLILSIYPEEQYAIRVIKAGASGYLNKDLAPDELVNAVHRVLNGRKYITASIAEQLASNLDYHSDKPLHEVLSNREFEVFKLLAAGKPISDIAAQLNLSVTTISTFRSRVLKKMNLRSNAELTQYAIQYKII